MFLLCPSFLCSPSTPLFTSPHSQFLSKAGTISLSSTPSSYLTHLSCCSSCYIQLQRVSTRLMHAHHYPTMSCNTPNTHQSYAVLINQSTDRVIFSPFGRKEEVRKRTDDLPGLSRHWDLQQQVSHNTNQIQLLSALLRCHRHPDIRSVHTYTKKEQKASRTSQDERFHAW